jgi:Spy/CpxP family protein refolding chaperone
LEGAVVKKHSRRTILTLVAGASAASLATAATAFPADPIYAAIERHKATGAVLDATGDGPISFSDLHMNDEQQRQLKRLEEAVRC